MSTNGESGSPKDGELGRRVPRELDAGDDPQYVQQMALWIAAASLNTTST